MTESLDAWGYVRLSQSGREGNIEEQLRAVREYARESDRLSLATTLNEGDKTSGFNSERPKYQRLVSKIREAEIDAVVVRDRARLSRDFDERMRLLTYFRETGVELHVIEAGGVIEVEDVQVAAMEGMHAAMDHMKKKMEIRRSREAIEERLEKGFDQGRPPFGLEFDEAGEYWVPKEGEFETALKVIELREGGASLRSIEEETGVPVGTVRRIVERRERYEAEAEAITA